ncbi:MAG: MFS transporter [Deltaproteobacteria bacterium]|nr:MFS transporter [Deltaproteobacteria bacterium]
MEMIERLAYYGVKAVATLYARDPASKGGLGLDMSQFGTILMVWALLQSVVPVFTGGLSDRYGYKETIFASTVVKIAGYLVMGFFPTFNGFFAGAVLLATGTAIFKPGIQGTLVKSTTRQNSSMAWGIFYQTVNIGGFIGPLVAGKMRKLAWRNVFFACAGIISCNFLMLLTYREVGKDERLRRARLRKEGKLEQRSLAGEALRELGKRHVWVYLLIFSGFWFMFNAIFDVLPAYLEDWVDTRGVVTTLFGAGGAESALAKFFIVMSKDGKEIQPEGMLNLNAGLIMTTCFLFAALSGRLRATSSMVIGTLFAALALVLSGYATVGWLSVFAILVFSVGEMLSSPKFSEFIGNFAPDDKKAMYLGFSQIPLAVGWTLEGKVGPWLYETFASKDRFARELLRDKGLPAERVAKIPNGEAFDHLALLTQESGALDSSRMALLRDPDGAARALLARQGMSAGELSELKVGGAFRALAERMDKEHKWQLTRALHRTHPRIGMVWYIMAAVGLVTALGIYLYGRWIAGLREKAGRRATEGSPS